MYLSTNEMERKMINPTKLIKLKFAWDKFSKNHPKFPKFLNAVHKNAIEEGTIIEIKVTSAAGDSYSSNLKLTKSDKDLMSELTELFGNL